MPGFTAAASLYKTSRHYRTGKSAINLTAHKMGTIRLSEIDVPGEVIIIEDDAPWSPPSWGGHTGPGTSGDAGDTGGGEPGGGGGGGIPSTTDPNDKPQPGLHGCSANQIQSEAAQPCEKQMEQDLMSGVKNRHYTRCTGSKKGNVVHPKMECCQRVGHKTTCTKL
jgi:hypothetical protein